MCKTCDANIGTVAKAKDNHEATIDSIADIDVLL